MSPSEPRRPGRPPKGTRGDTRQELLDAALELFARKGYAATTVRQIADRVGIRDSAIYAHFDAKSELLDTLIEEAGPQCIDRIGFEFPRLSDQPPRDALPPFVERLVAEWDRPRARRLVSLLAREGFEGAADVVAAAQDRFAPHFDRWIRAGHLRGDLSAQLLLWELVTPLAAIRILHINAHAAPHRRQEGRRLAREHVRFFLATAGASGAQRMERL